MSKAKPGHLLEDSLAEDKRTKPQRQYDAFVYISAASGLWSPQDDGVRVDHRLTGSVLEFAAKTTWGT